MIKQQRWVMIEQRWVTVTGGDPKCENTKHRPVSGSNYHKVSVCAVCGSHIELVEIDTTPAPLVADFSIPPKIPRCTICGLKLPSEARPSARMGLAYPYTPGTEDDSELQLLCPADAKKVAEYIAYLQKPALTEEDL